MTEKTKLTKGTPTFVMRDGSRLAVMRTPQGGGSPVFIGLLAENGLLVNEEGVAVGMTALGDEVVPWDNEDIITR